jgi:hypothetical protein
VTFERYDLLFLKYRIKKDDIQSMTVLLPSALIDKIYTLISTITNLLTLLISLCLLSFFIYRFIYFNSFHRKTILQNIPILLSINTLCLLIIRSIFQFFDIDLNTIKRNYLSINEFNDSFTCRLRGYLLLSIHSTLYWSYALQAVFRFIRVIFPRYIWLYQSNIYFYIFIPIQFLLGFLGMLPIFIGFNAIHLLFNEPYCTASFGELVSLIYMPIVSFVLPISTISICYMCIVWKTRRITTTMIRPYQQRNRRDCQLIRRIIIIIIILSAVSVPLIIDLFIYLPKGYTDPYMNSIAWVSSSINAVILVISLPYINPKMYELFKGTNRVNVQIIFNH